MKIKDKKVILIVLGLLLCFGITGHSFAESKDPYTFYMVSHGGPATPFWEVVIRGMNEAAKLLGVKAV